MWTCEEDRSRMSHCNGGKEGPLTPRWNREWDSGIFGAFSPSFAIAKISDMHHIIGAIIDKR